MITTSYFGSKARKASKVCIAKKAPQGFTGLHIKEFAPSHPWAKDWKASYLLDLQTRFPGGEGLDELLQNIESKVTDPVFCCYEKSPGSCHRSVLAEYIEKHLGSRIEEWQA